MHKNLKDKEFSSEKSPLFVAEISGNHLGNFDRCIELIDLAAESGASAVKFQTFLPERMTLDIDDDNFRVVRDHPLWGGEKLIDLYRKTQTPLSWHEELFSHARAVGMIPFSTPFDIESVEFLEQLNCPIYKIASLESSDLTLIKKAASTLKPMVISTGATHFNEITDAVEACLSVGNSDITLLLCTSSYPANPADANLARFKLLTENYQVKIGLSDHTLGIGVSVAAIALGAVLIEKHFTKSREDGGPDAQFSLEPGEFASLVQEGRNAWESLGKSEWLMAESELESRRLRRSLYISENVLKGEIVSNSNVRAVRPGYGISPKFLPEVLGKTFNSNYSAGSPLKLENLD